MFELLEAMPHNASDGDDLGEKIMGKALSCIVVFCLILFGLLGPAEARRVALVIGNSAYEHAVPLENPKNDADALAAVLERLDFEVVKGIDLKRSEFEKTVRNFSRTVRGAEVALLFYAGHGLQVNGLNYLAPIDARLTDEADLDFETVQLATILKQMEREAKTNLIFLDACRDNPLAKNLARSMGTRSVSVGRGLARVNSGIGTLIAFATEPGNVALDGEGANSPFTTALLSHIETPGLDIAQLMRRVRRDVMTLTAERQVPWNNSSLTGDFYFSGKVTITAGAGNSDGDKRFSQLQEELEKLKQQMKDKLAPQKTPKDDQKTAALQKELDSLKAQLKQEKKSTAIRQNRSTPEPDKQAPIESSKNTETALAWFNKGDVAYRRADYNAAFSSYKKGAELGNADAMFYLGIMHYKGQSGPQNFTEAAHWIEKAAKLDHGKATFELAQLYTSGQGVNKDPVKAASLFFSAADKGIIESYYDLARIHDGGLGVAKDPIAAARYLVKSLKAKDSFTATELTANANAWDTSSRRELQSLMKDEGVYSGPVDGNFGPGTISAIKKLAGQD